MPPDIPDRHPVARRPVRRRATTVKTRNLLGRTYPAAIKPFHRIIARTS
ncbi:DUF2867 domain-containing protein [Aliidongia sp.]